jgi:hypothetical protein
MMEDIDIGSDLVDADVDWELLDQQYDAPPTPSTTSDDAPQQPSFSAEPSEAESDDEYQHGDLVRRPKPGGYDSRIQQILYENPELPILITDAGKSLESGGKFIVYTIRTGVSLGLVPPGKGRLQLTRCFYLGLRGSASILGICLASRCLDETTSNLDHSSDSREAHHGGLCRQPYQGQAGPPDHRLAQAHVGRLPESMPPDGASSDRWRVVEIP